MLSQQIYRAGPEGPAGAELLTDPGFDQRRQHGRGRQDAGRHAVLARPAAAVLSGDAGRQAGRVDRGEPRSTAITPTRPFLASHRGRIRHDRGRGRHAAALDDAQAADGAGQALPGVLPALWRARPADGDQGLGRGAGAGDRRQGLYLFPARQSRLGQSGRGFRTAALPRDGRGRGARPEGGGDVPQDARFRRSGQGRDLWLVLWRLHDAEAAGGRTRASTPPAFPARR